MNKYRIELKIKIEKILSKFPLTDAKRIRDKIRSLQENPRPAGIEKMQGTTNEYRVRVGKYRILYQIQDKILIIYIVDIDHRKDIYRG